jgi:hypothetical protein
MGHKSFRLGRKLSISSAWKQSQRAEKPEKPAVWLWRVEAVAARKVSRFARNSRDWQQLVEVGRVVNTVFIDQETVYSPQLGAAGLRDSRGVGACLP